MVDGCERREFTEPQGEVTLPTAVVEDAELLEDLPPVFRREWVLVSAARDAVEDEHLCVHCAAEGYYEAYFDLVGL